MLLCLERAAKDLHYQLDGKTVEQVEQMFGLDSQAEAEKELRAAPTSRSGRHAATRSKDGGHTGAANGRPDAPRGLVAKRIEAKAQKRRERQKMVHTYRDRLLPRFCAD